IPTRRNARIDAENKDPRAVKEKVIASKTLTNSKPLLEQKNQTNNTTYNNGLVSKNGKGTLRKPISNNDENAPNPTLVKRKEHEPVKGKVGGKTIAAKENVTKEAPAEKSQKVERKSGIPKPTLKSRQANIVDENIKPANFVEPVINRKSSVLTEAKHPVTQIQEAHSQILVARKHSNIEQQQDEQINKKMRTLVEIKQQKPVYEEPVHEEPVYEDSFEEQIEKVEELIINQPEVIEQEEEDEDESDPMMVSEYANEIFDYLRELELKTMPVPDYIEGHEELTWKMRSILIDWIIEIHHKFRMLPETLFLAVNVLDRFLSLRVCSLAKLQLVGVAALFVAAKYEEMAAPVLQQFLLTVDEEIKDEEVLKAERYLLQVLEFGLHFPNPLNFLRRCSKADQYDIQTRTLAKYLMEITLLDHRLLACPPSLIAASSLHCARNMLQREDGWNSDLVFYSGYEQYQVDQVQECILYFLVNDIGTYDSLYRKYQSKKFMKASVFVEEWLIRRGFLQPVIVLHKKISNMYGAQLPWGLAAVDADIRQTHRRAKSASADKNEIEVLFADIPDDAFPVVAPTPSNRSTKGRLLSPPTSPAPINLYAGANELDPEVQFGTKVARERANSSSRFTSAFSGFLGTATSPPAEESKVTRPPHTRTRSYSSATSPGSSPVITHSVTLYDQKLCIYKLMPDSVPKYLIPHLVATVSFFSINRTKSELTIVVPEEFKVRADSEEPEPIKDANWRCYKLEPSASASQGVVGGIIAKALSEQRITFQMLSVLGTQHILVKQHHIFDVSKIMKDAGFEVRQARERLGA
ncbi:G2/mitotic-specific cyclin, partial [Nowakowskiella sp. JEL0078]